MGSKRSAAPGNRRLLGAAGLPLFVSYGVVGLTTLSFGTLRQPGTGVFPLIVAILGALGSLALLVGRNTRVTIEGDAPEEWPTSVNAVRLIVIVAMTVVYVVLLDYIGYLMATFLFALALLRQLSGQSWTRQLLAAALYAGVTYYVFVVLLGVPLPRTTFIWDVS